MEEKHYYFVFCDDELMLLKQNDGTWTIPCTTEPPTPTGNNVNVMKVYPLNMQEVRTYRLPERPETGARYEFCRLRNSYYKLTPELYHAAGKCHELLYWDANTRFCGVCGAPMKMHTAISKKCEVCGKEIWPQLATAIIVLVSRGDEMLLVHARNFKGRFFGLVAGFVETGETLEQAVHREVKEETGLEIDELRYFGSQPWPYPCGLMVGFFARYVSGEIKLQDSELAAGSWFRPGNLPELPEKLSIARRLIDHWLAHHNTADHPEK